MRKARASSAVGRHLERGASEAASGSSSPADEEDDLNRLEQDEQVKKEREVLDVVKIVLELLVRFLNGGCVVMADLSPAGDAGLHGQAADVKGDPLSKDPDELGTLRPRPDKAHVADQDVEQLWQFVQASLPQESSDASDSWVSSRRPHGTRRPLGVLVHGAELIENEDLPIPPHPLLAEKNRPGGVEFDENCDKPHEGERDGQADERKDDIDTAFQRLRAVGIDKAVAKDEPAWAQTDHEDLPRLLFIERRPFLYLNAAEAALE